MSPEKKRNQSTKTNNTGKYFNGLRKENVYRRNSCLFSSIWMTSQICLIWPTSPQRKDVSCVMHSCTKVCNNGHTRCIGASSLTEEFSREIKGIMCRASERVGYKKYWVPQQGDKNCSFGDLSWLLKKILALHRLVPSSVFWDKKRCENHKAFGIVSGETSKQPQREQCPRGGRKDLESVTTRSRRGCAEAQEDSPTWGPRPWLRIEARSQNHCGLCRQLVGKREGGLWGNFLRVICILHGIWEIQGRYLRSSEITVGGWIPLHATRPGDGAT